MELTELSAEGLRNLEPLRLDPHPRFNLLEGANGQGKTNLLEAIYLCATLRSFREARVKGLVHFDREEAWVRGTIVRRGVSRGLAVEIGPRGRRAAVDGKVVSRLSDYFGHMHVVVFAPDDLQLTKGGPELRRRFLDRAIVNLQPGYWDEARAYQRALKHRNELLRTSSGRHLDPVVMESFDIELVRRAARVRMRRLAFIEALRPAFLATFAEVTGGGLEAAMRYTRSAGDEAMSEEELADRYAERLESGRETDRKRGFTGTGPHADDLGLELMGHPARQHASQGQHRAYALSLKIAELQLAADRLGAWPVLLLDDVSSELDRDRNARLMDFLDRSGGQVFVTTTDRSWIQVQGATRIFRVEGGIVHQES